MKTLHAPQLLQGSPFGGVNDVDSRGGMDTLAGSKPVYKGLERLEKVVLPESMIFELDKAGPVMNTRICLPTQKGFKVMKFHDIIYCEAQRSYTSFRFLDNKYMVISKPLFDYDKILSGSVFFRIHKSFLINLFHLKEYVTGEGGRVIMSNGTELDVSRRRKEQFLERLKQSFIY